MNIRKTIMEVITAAALKLTACEIRLYKTGIN
jgi:hypothetical protein